MALDSVRLTGTTDGSGNVTITASEAVAGFVYAVEWIDGDLVDGVDGTLSVTSTPSGVDNTILTLTNANNDAWHYPRLATSDNTGAALTDYAYPLAAGKLKLVIAQGGATKTGGCVVYLFT